MRKLHYLLLGLLLLLAVPSGAEEKAEVYRIRPGDVLNVTVVPQSAYGHVITVQPDGQVSYPVAGELRAAGLTLAEFRDALSRGLEKELNNPRLTVSLQSSAPERLPQITILGAVRTPGLFDLRKGWRLSEALAAAGGPQVNADLRRITITHADRTVRTVDLTLGGELSERNNVEIRPHDLILVLEGEVPARPQVTVLGAVRAPGLFEYRQGWRLSEAVASAGGPTPEADLTRVTITRSDRTVETADLTLNPDGTQKQNVILRAGDLVLVIEGERKRPTVTVVGEVARPGSYELQPNMSLLELLTLAGGATAKADVRRATLTRSVSGQEEPVNLGDLLAGNGSGKNLKLEPGDRLVVPENPQRAVVIGEVARQGEFALHGGESVLDLLVQAGGASSSANLSKVTILRRGKGSKPETIALDLRRAATKGDRDILKVEPGDLLFVPPRDQRQRGNWSQFLGPLNLLFGAFGGGLGF